MSLSTYEKVKKGILSSYIYNLAYYRHISFYLFSHERMSFATFKKKCNINSSNTRVSSFFITKGLYPEDKIEVLYKYCPKYYQHITLSEYQEAQKEILRVQAELMKRNLRYLSKLWWHVDTNKNKILEKLNVARDCQSKHISNRRFVKKLKRRGIIFTDTQVSDMFRGRANYIHVDILTIMFDILGVLSIEDVEVPDNYKVKSRFILCKQNSKDINDNIVDVELEDQDIINARNNIDEKEESFAVEDDEDEEDITRTEGLIKQCTEALSPIEDTIFPVVTVKRVCCKACGKYHDYDSKTYISVWGNIFIGANGNNKGNDKGIVGENFAQTTNGHTVEYKLARVSVFCIECFKTYILDQIKLKGALTS